MFRIAINSMALTGKIPAGDSRWSTFNDSFRNLNISEYEIANAIADGHAYAAWHNGRRKTENFDLAQHIAVDMDTGDERSSIDVLAKMPLVREYAALIHTTPSHTPEAPRARVLFLLDHSIASATAYMTAAAFLLSLFDGADQACKDASRFFYGSLNCQMWLTDNVLPLAELRTLYRQWARRNPQPLYKSSDSGQRAYKPSDFADWSEMLIAPVRQANEGERNNTLNRQAFLAGKDIAQSRVNESEIETQLIWAAQSVGLSEAEALATVRSGIRSGKAAM